MQLLLVSFSLSASRLMSGVSLAMMRSGMAIDDGIHADIVLDMLSDNSVYTW